MPPGTAWGAEGQRGNEANENNLMVLAPERTRKGQTSLLLHRRPAPSGFGIRQSTCARWLNSYCAVTFSVIASELVIGLAPPVVALIVTA